MKVLSWNLSWANEVMPKIEYLRKQIFGKTFIVILQEVKPHVYDSLKELLSDIAHIEYSLSYRSPGKYDTNSRKLGIAILISKDIVVKNAKVIDRALMPDRTLMVDVTFNNMPLRILGLHSLTGCQHLKAKEVQYFSFAEAIDTYTPDIVGIDANEPQVDHYDISQMRFFDNYQNGNGCKTFFETMKQNALVDAFVKNYDKSNFVEGEYLTTSHIIKRGNKKVRYDFLFINKEKFNDYSCIYEYEGAVCAGSDHAAIIVEWKHNIYHMKLHPAPFAMIKSGQKTIELRLFDEKRQHIREGDEIVFTNTESGETLTKTVMKLHHFDSFEELYRALPLLQCGYTAEDIDTAHPSDMEQYYSVDEQKKYGVVGIEVC